MSSPHFSNKGGVGAHIAGVTLTEDAVAQAIEIAKAKLTDGLNRGAIEEKDFPGLLRDVVSRLGNGRVKFGPLGLLLVLSVGPNELKELPTPQAAMAEVARLKNRYDRYNVWVNDRKRPRKKRQKIAGAVLEYRTVSLPAFWSEPLRLAVDSGLIPGEAFKTWILKIVSALAKHFEVATRYGRVEKGLNVKLAAVHPQQGTLHFHLGFVSVDENGNRLGLIGSKGRDGGGNRLVTNDLQMWAIAMRRLRTLKFEPVPRAVKTRTGDAVIHGWELLDMRITRCTTANSKNYRRIGGQGLGPTWDMILNDLVDSEIAQLRVQYPRFDRLCVESEQHAREENAKKARAARDALGVGLREENLRLAEKLAMVEAKMLQAEAKLTLFDKVLLQKLTPDVIASTEDAWWRAAHRVDTSADAIYLSDALFERFALELRFGGASFGPRLENLKLLGMRLRPKYFGEQAIPSKGLDSERPLEPITPELVDRTEVAWWRAFYRAETHEDEPFLSDAFVARIAAELEASNTLFNGRFDQFRSYGQKLWPQRFGSISASAVEEVGRDTDPDLDRGMGSAMTK
jgi:hypothetical protein